MKRRLAVLIMIILASLLSSCCRAEDDSVIKKKTTSALAGLAVSSDPESFARSHGIKLKNGMVGIVIKLGNRTYAASLAAKYNLKDFTVKGDVIFAYARVSAVKQLCGDPAVIYIRQPAEFEGMGKASKN